MAPRRTILLDDEAREAVRELAESYGCSLSEAVRRAVIERRNAVLGLAQAQRRGRRQALQRLFVLFKGHVAEREVARLKVDDAGF